MGWCITKQAITSQDGWKAQWDNCDPSKLRWYQFMLRHLMSRNHNCPHPHPPSVRCLGFHHHPQQTSEMPKQAMDFCWEETSPSSATWDCPITQIPLNTTGLSHNWAIIQKSPTSSMKQISAVLLANPHHHLKNRNNGQRWVSLQPASPLRSSRERIQKLAYGMVENISPHFWKRPVINCNKKQACTFPNIAQVFSGPGDSWYCIF